MSTALSLDLRVRVLAAVASGMTHRAVGERFGVSAASVSRWRAREREQGDARPKALGGDRKSHRIEAHKDTVLAALGPDRDRTIEEMRRTLADQGLVFGFGTLQRLFARHKITRKKKTAHASEQTRPDVLSRREAWFDGQRDLDPERLVFIDETWASTNMARRHGDAPGVSASGSASPTATGKPRRSSALSRCAGSSPPSSWMARSTAMLSRPIACPREGGGGQGAGSRTAPRRCRGREQPPRPHRAQGWRDDRGRRRQAALFRRTVRISIRSRTPSQN